MRRKYFTQALLSCLIIASTSSVLFAQQDRGMQLVDDMSSNERIALVIGNSNYSTAPLANPVNDAQDQDSVVVPKGIDLSP